MPRTGPSSPEALAKISARMKARWATNREAMIEQSRRGGKTTASKSARPPAGTEARRYFDKIVRIAGAPAAHAHFAAMRRDGQS